MTGIARKVIIYAAIDGLIIQPLSSKGQRPAPPVRIRYGDASIVPASREQIPNVSSSPNNSFEAFGVVGPSHYCSTRMYPYLADPASHPSKQDS